MKNILRSLLLCTFFVSCEKQDIELTDPAHLYFVEIAMKNEVYQTDINIRKWTKDVKLHFVGTHPIFSATVEEEREKIVEELDELIDEISIEIVDNEEEANVIGYFGFYNDYVEIYEPEFEGLFPSTPKGAFNIKNRKGDICSATFFININEVGPDILKSVIREEMTQIMGLPNDSETYFESVFYQGFPPNWPTEYAEIDKQIISLLYSDDIKPNMNECKVRKVLSKL